MLNEIEKFNAYTGIVNYRSENKYDSTYLGRFTYDMLMKFEGLSRVLTIITRGYMWQTGTGLQIDLARRALCAWCSIPDAKKALPKKEGQSQTDFKELHGEFPELVDANGSGWFYRHVHEIVAFVQQNPDKVMKSAAANCERLSIGFDAAWRKKIMQFQVPLFSANTKGAWVLRFDDVLSDALEQGALKNNETPLLPEILQKLSAVTPKGVPESVLPTLVQYYLASKPENYDWVVLPVANFDAYFGTTSFSRKWLGSIHEDVIVRENGFGVCRYKIFL
ncbi:MAG: hypothetical protein A2Y17_12105 [Clostridiales bacterium GWF2_38_85]|nr:MAG: hypothetical protein A2Y17_12105 [Clostridiales bacterium GWF2_38_85]